MIACVFLGLFLGIILGFCLIWDVCTNGFIKTDADTILCMLIGIGTIVAGGSVAKIAGERKNIIKDKIVENGKCERAETVHP